MAWSEDERADDLHTTVPCEWFEELLLDLRQPPVVNPVLELAAMRRGQIVGRATRSSPTASF